MSNLNDKLHRDALAVVQRMKPNKGEQAARDAAANYNVRRKEQVEKLKPILVEMDRAFGRGEVVGGCTGMKDYCKEYKSKGMLTYARVRQILTGTSGNEGKVKSLDLLKELIMVISAGSPEIVTDKVSAICEQINWTPPDSKMKEEESEQPKNPVVTEMEKTLEATEPINLPDGIKEEQCDYSEAEVAAMFAGGGK